MKIVKVAPLGEIEIFPSKTMAASDAGIERHKFSRLIEEGPIETALGIYSIPFEHKTKRHDGCNH